VVAKSTVVVVVVVGVVVEVDVSVDAEVLVLPPFEPLTSVVALAVVVGFPVCGAFAVVAAPVPFGAFVTWVVVE